MIEVRAPATSANLGSGFDVFGVALNKPADVVRVGKADETSIEVKGAGARYIPEDPRKNTAGEVARQLGVDVRIEIDKGVRPSSGLGSSAASAAGVAVGIDELFEMDLSDDELIGAAAEGERVVSGEAHKDNVAPCVKGGFTVSDPDDGTVGFPAEFHCVVALPDLILSTSDARDALPERVSLGQRSKTVADASKVVAGVLRDDIELLGSGMQDEVVEDARSELIDGYETARERAVEAGAVAVTISGAGPSLLGVCERDDKPDVAEAFVEVFWEEGVESRAYQARVGDGAQVTGRRL
ncbi:MAG: homoserine kinase [Halobacteria archaeon]|nr:homoserine kinase [Halobacteria archaeon]